MRQFRLVGAQVIQFVASRSLRDWGVAVMAILATLLLTPRACEATCGDYLHGSDLQGRGRSATMLPSMPNQTLSTDGRSDILADTNVPQRHRPCQGPGCSGRSSPPQAPVPSIEDSSERWALVPADTAPNLICSDQLLAELFDLVADGSRLSILRPPR